MIRSNMRSAGQLDPSIRYGTTRTQSDATTVNQRLSDPQYLTPPPRSNVDPRYDASGTNPYVQPTSQPPVTEQPSDQFISGVPNMVVYAVGAFGLFLLLTSSKSRTNPASSQRSDVKRYIGDAIVTIGWSDDHGDYRGKVQVKNGSYTSTWHFTDLHPPRMGHGAVDSAESYDKMAAAAVSFGSYGDDASSKETADAISDATSWAQNDRGQYKVRRSMKGQGHFVA